MTKKAGKRQKTEAADTKAQIVEPTVAYEVEKGRSPANMAALEEYRDYLAKLVAAEDGLSQEDVEADILATTEDLDMYEEARQAKARDFGAGQEARGLVRDADKQKTQEEEAKWNGAGLVPHPPGLINNRHEPFPSTKSQEEKEDKAIARLLGNGDPKLGSTSGGHK